MTSSNKVKGFAAGVVAAVCYGTNPLGTLELYGDGFNSSSVLIYRYLLAVLMFAVVMLFRKESFKVNPPNTHCRSRSAGCVSYGTL